MLRAKIGEEGKERPIKKPKWSWFDLISVLRVQADTEDDHEGREAGRSVGWWKTVESASFESNLKLWTSQYPDRFAKPDGRSENEANYGRAGKRNKKTEKVQMPGWKERPRCEYGWTCPENVVKSGCRSKKVISKVFERERPVKMRFEKDDERKWQVVCHIWIWLTTSEPLHRTPKELDRKWNERKAFETWEQWKRLKTLLIWTNSVRTK